MHAHCGNLLSTYDLSCVYVSSSRECFVPMSEFSNLKQFSGYINQVFPGATLFLVCTDGEFKQFFMELTRAFLQDTDRRSVFGARFIGRNVASNGAEAWVLSKTAQLHPDGSWIEPSTSQFVWLTTPGCEHSVTKSLACSVQYPLDQGRSIHARELRGMCCHHGLLCDGSYVPRCGTSLWTHWCSLHVW